MISCAIWCIHQIVQEIILLLNINNLHENGITESQDRPNFDSTGAICNLLWCYNFALE